MRKATTFTYTLILIHLKIYIINIHLMFSTFSSIMTPSCLILHVMNQLIIAFKVVPLSLNIKFWSQWLIHRESHEKLDRRTDRIGRVYKKAIYRGFTDGTFTQPIQVPGWAGLLGPPIKTEVGDVVYIHFQNWAKGSNFSIHPYGFFYNKANEGTNLIDLSIYESHRKFNRLFLDPNCCQCWFAMFVFL